MQDPNNKLIIQDGIAYDDKYYYVWTPDDISTLVRLSRQNSTQFDKKRTNFVLFLSHEQYAKNFELIKKQNRQFGKRFHPMISNENKQQQFRHMLRQKIYNVDGNKETIFICSQVYAFHLLKRFSTHKNVQIWKTFTCQTQTTNTKNPFYSNFKIIKTDCLTEKIQQKINSESQYNFYQNQIYDNFYQLFQDKDKHKSQNMRYFVSNDFLNKKYNQKVILQLLCNLQLNNPLDIDHDEILKFKQECEKDHQKVLNNIILKYSEENFLHKIMNKILMASPKFQQAIYIQPIYSALFQSIREIYKRQQLGIQKLTKRPQKDLHNFTCYRGARLNNTEMQNFIKKKNNPIISHSNFLSTSYDIKVAANFIVNALIVIYVSSEKKRSEQIDYGFAFVEDYVSSKMAPEKQVLFNSMNSYQLMQVLTQQQIQESTQKSHQNIKGVLKKNDQQKIVIFLKYGAVAQIYNEIQVQQNEEVSDRVNTEETILKNLRPSVLTNDKSRVNAFVQDLMESKYDPFNSSFSQCIQLLNAWSIPFMIKVAQSKKKIMDSFPANKIKFDEYLQTVLEIQFQRTFRNFKNCQFYKITKNITSYENDLTFQCAKIFFLLGFEIQAKCRQRIFALQKVQKIFKKKNKFSKKSYFVNFFMFSLAKQYMNINCNESVQRIRQQFFNFKVYQKQKNYLSINLLHTRLLEAKIYENIQDKIQQLKELNFINTFIGEFRVNRIPNYINIIDYYESKCNKLGIKLQDEVSFQKTQLINESPHFFYERVKIYLKNKNIEMAQQYLKMVILQFDEWTQQKQNNNFSGVNALIGGVNVFISFINYFTQKLQNDFSSNTKYHKIFVKQQNSYVNFINKLIQIIMKKQSKLLLQSLITLKIIKACSFVVLRIQKQEGIKILKDCMFVFQKQFKDSSYVDVLYYIYVYLGQFCVGQQSIYYLKRGLDRIRVTKKSQILQGQQILFYDKQNRIIQQIIIKLKNNKQIKQCVSYCWLLIQNINSFPIKKNQNLNKFCLLLADIFFFQGFFQVAETYLQIFVNLADFNNGIITYKQNDKFIITPRLQDLYITMQQLFHVKFLLGKVAESIKVLKKLIVFWTKVPKCILPFVIIVVNNYKFLLYNGLDEAICLAKQQGRLRQQNGEKVYDWVFQQLDQLIPCQQFLSQSFKKQTQQICYFDFIF